MADQPDHPLQGRNSVSIRPKIVPAIVAITVHNSLKLSVFYSRSVLLFPKRASYIVSVHQARRGLADYPSDISKRSGQLFMILATFQVIAGLALLVIAGDFMVKGAVSLANTFGLSPLLIGLTIIALGTSAPELVVSVDAVLSGLPALALGNVVGSNIANALLVIGLPTFIAPLTCSAPRLNHNMAFMIGSTLLFIALALDKSFSFYDGLILIAALVTFLVYSGYRGQKNPNAADSTLKLEEELKSSNYAPILATLIVIGGCAGLIFGADLLVNGAVEVATRLGVSEAVIGLTLVALGTSLPELATSTVAAIRGHCDVALGNAIGSNIFNITGIMGIASVIDTIPVADNFFRLDFWVMLAAALVILPFTMRRGAIGRVGGLFLILSYAAYIGWLAYGGTDVSTLTGMVS